MPRRSGRLRSVRTPTRCCGVKPSPSVLDGLQHIDARNRLTGAGRLAFYPGQVEELAPHMAEQQT